MLTGVWKKPLSLCVAMAAGSLGCQSSLAFGLGDIQTSSRLGEPLNAVIRVEDPGRSIRAEDLVVRRIDAGEARRMGFEPTGDELDTQNSEFEVLAQDGPQGVVVQVRSKEPVTEPYMNLLVELKWSSNQTYREYTLLFDPHPQMASVKPLRTSHASASYQVQSGDCLTAIAERWLVGTGQSLEATTEWLYQNNSHAFADGNIDQLRDGVHLRLPTEADLPLQTGQRLAQAQPRRHIVTRAEQAALLAGWNRAPANQATEANETTTARQPAKEPILQWLASSGTVVESLQQELKGFKGAAYGALMPAAPRTSRSRGGNGGPGVSEPVWTGLTSATSVTNSRSYASSPNSPWSWWLALGMPLAAVMFYWLVLTQRPQQVAPSAVARVSDQDLNGPWNEEWDGDATRADDRDAINALMEDINSEALAATHEQGHDYQESMARMLEHGLEWSDDELEQLAPVLTERFDPLPQAPGTTISLGASQQPVPHPGAIERAGQVYCPVTGTYQWPRQDEPAQSSADTGFANDIFSDEFLQATSPRHDDEEVKRSIREKMGSYHPPQPREDNYVVCEELSQPDLEIDLAFLAAEEKQPSSQVKRI